MSDIDSVVSGLARQLQVQKRQRYIRSALFVCAIAALGGGYVAYRRSHAPPPKARFELAAVEKRSIVEEVQSTGVVEPLNQVDVGAQVSGRIVSVGVDFNETVKSGQLLAEIDPQLFGAEVSQSQAQLYAARAAINSAQARRNAVQVRVDRLKPLVAENIASVAELENALGDLQVAEAETATAKAQIAQLQARLKSAKTTLDYTKIYSPIDGVVINRQVEPGQTVAASFNTPVLFTIAQDLTKMRVVAEIDEADVGKVKENMAAEVSVDAFPNDHFGGKLTQIRLAPQNVDGVVTYAAVIEVDNPDNKLRPGMTATATITTRKVDDVLAVRNSALRFEPATPDKEDEDKSSQNTELKKLPRPGPEQGRLFVQAEGPPSEANAEALIVDVGITDGVWTEVKSGLTPGQRVIVDERLKKSERGFRLF